MDDDMTLPPVQQLPDDLLQEILLRLPPRSIARCLAVCKGWRSAISATSFRRAHAERPAVVAIVTAMASYCPECDACKLPDRMLYLSDSANCDAVSFKAPFRWRDGRNTHLHMPHSSRSPRRLVFPSHSGVLDTLVVGSWDGVLCVQRGVPLREYVLWNPTAKTCATVSPPPSRGVIIGGYTHPSTTRFHLLHASPRSLGPGLFAPTAFRIHRVGDGGAWREVPLLLPGGHSLTMHGARSVSLHGNLHWIVQLRGSAAQRLRVLVFEPAHERFRLIEAPPPLAGRGEEDLLARSRVCVMSNGQLCVVAVCPATSTMEMWVLDDDYHSDAPRRWRLKERLSLMVMWCMRDPSTTFTSETQVEVVHGDVEGEEVMVHHNGLVDVYSLRRRRWSSTFCVSRSEVCVVDAALLPYRESVAQPSFGEATRLLQHTVKGEGNCWYYLKSM
uniref:F-box domain-containing protein n=1 Tax=Leersia perrieri TaxID=77586 RepID=A0A0D9VUH3_9ORYZ